MTLRRLFQREVLIRLPDSESADQTAFICTSKWSVWSRKSVLPSATLEVPA